MHILITILIVIAIIAALVLVLALLSKKAYNAHQEIVINASKQKVFDYIKHLRNQEHFNKWVMTDPGMKKQLTGIDGTVGFIYAWNGNKKAGEGEQEIKSITEGERIETEVRFVRPYVSVAYSYMTTESIAEQQTKLSWNNSGKIPIPMNIMVTVIEKMLSKDMNTSLAQLKTILEK